MRLITKTVGDPVATAERTVEDLERGTTRAIRRVGTGLKEEWRGQITAGGLGKRLGNTIRNNNYPKTGASISAASLVYSKASHIVLGHQGAIIRSNRGFWLTIPTEQTVLKWGSFRRKLTVGAYERRYNTRLVFVYGKNGKDSVLIDTGRADRDRRMTAKGFHVKARNRRTKDAVAFILKPMVRLPRRLNFDRATDKWEARLPLMILQEWGDV